MYSEAVQKARARIELKKAWEDYEKLLKLSYGDSIIKWDEGEHPRDEDGTFTDSGGSSDDTDDTDDKSETSDTSGTNRSESKDVMLPDGRMGKLASGSEITKIVTFAGKGTKTEIRVAGSLEQQYGVEAKEWKKTRGDGYVDCGDGDIRHSELHWYETEKTGRVQMKVKRYFDES